ncbi:hypothetical protein ACFWFZ_14065 [Streptomyces sp. NPDC060232]
MTPPAQDAARQALTAALRRHEADGGVWLRSSSWLVTAVRGGATRS